MKTIVEFNEAFKAALETKDNPVDEQSPFPTNADFVNVIRKYSGNICLNLSDGNIEILIRPIKIDLFTEINRPAVSRQSTFFQIDDNSDDGFIIIAPFIK